MNQEHRDELRQKHFLWKDKECNYDGEPFPCDAIRVLNNYESLISAVRLYFSTPGYTTNNILQITLGEL